MRLNELSLTVGERTTQRLIEKCAKTNFNNASFGIAVKEVGVKFHINFVVGFRVHH
jgi:hypothetical protein